MKSPAKLRAEEKRIRELEAEGMTRSDAQGVYMAEQLARGIDPMTGRKLPKPKATPKVREVQS